ncbi:MAG TPA: hypothetical protein VN880_01145 [Solirubrobacteraceae bacterium]|nr:hypothetical protein [Solirubrobacteraceae bacterium]
MYGRMRADALSRAVPRAPGYIGGMLEFVVPELRDGLRAIVDQHFVPADEREFAAIVARARALAGWIAEPSRA